MTKASQVTRIVKNLPAMQETQVQSLNWEDPLEKGMATQSSILAWRIPGMEESGGLLSMGSHACIGEGYGNPLQCSCLENPRDGGAWWAVVYGVTQSRT